jgi:DNA modification methylase
MTDAARILVGDVMDGLAQIADGSVYCCVTSPPYYALRDYGIDGQIGLESTPAEYVSKMVDVFREVRRVLRDDGVCFLNLGDSYAGGKTGRPDSFDGRSIDGKPVTAKQTEAPTTRTPPEGMKPKDLMMMPWRVALALQDDGWWIRSVIVWAKKSPMPESVTDRPTNSWEPIFLLTKSARYFYDAHAVREEGEGYGRSVWPTQQFKGGDITVHHGGGGGSHTPTGEVGRNQRNVWHLGPEPYKEAHFATYPSASPRRAIKAGTSEKGCGPTCGARLGVDLMPGDGSDCAAETNGVSISGSGRYSPPSLAGSGL